MKHVTLGRILSHNGGQYGFELTTLDQKDAQELKTCLHVYLKKMGYIVTPRYGALE